MNCKPSRAKGDRPESRIADKLPTTIPEWFRIFHQWDFIYAESTDSKPNWKTSTKGFPLSPKTLYKRWLDPAELIGVRFETIASGRTWYAMIDIDSGSQYHPSQNSTAITELLEVLEQKAGLCRHVRIRSSSSGGIHLYFPFPEAQPCLKTAFAIQNILIESGFRVAPGQLEVFPNTKSPDALYNGHRLPLQQGSYVLKADFQPTHNSLQQFVESWILAASHQDSEILTAVIEQTQTARSTTYQLNTSPRDIAEWKERLEETLKQGWTQFRQTNRIIKEVCQYAIVFLNKGRSWEELDWSGIREWIHQTIINLPGYEAFCNHQAEIKKRISEWLATNQKHKKYVPLGSQIKQVVQSKSSNQAKQEETLKRIEAAIDSILKERGALPRTVREREALIRRTARCGTKTLWKYKELWHPDYDPLGGATDRSTKEPAITTDSALAIADETEDSLQRQGTEECVTAHSVKIPADAEQLVKNSKTAESPVNQSVTPFPLLSVDIRKQEDPEAKSKLKQKSEFTRSGGIYPPTPRDLQEDFFERTSRERVVHEVSKASSSTQLPSPAQQTIGRTQDNRLLQGFRAFIDQTLCVKGLDLVSLKGNAISPLNPEPETPSQKTS